MIEKHVVLLWLGSSQGGHELLDYYGFDFIPCLTSLFQLRYLETRLAEEFGSFSHAICQFSFVAIACAHESFFGAVLWIDEIGNDVQFVETMFSYASSAATMSIIAVDKSERPDQVSPFIDLTFPPYQMATSGAAMSKHDATSDKDSMRNRGGNDSKDDQIQPRQIIWKNVIIMSGLHIVSLHAITRLSQYRLFTVAFGVVCYAISILGVTAGAHRLWTHRAYKAKLPMRVLLMLLNSIALQNSIFDWCRDHRTHHKFSETDADPHNASRGFFFSHIGWLLVRKHPDVAKKGRTILLNDLLGDPVVSFQRRFYVPMALTFCFVLPSLVPWYFGGETLWNAYCAAALRYCITLHVTWSVNSFAHMYGGKPYDKQIHPAENPLVSFFALGEGFHNYHHTFPHDYSTSEFGTKLNLTTVFIDLMAALGQAHDRRVIDKGTIEARKRRTGELADLRDAAW